MGTTRGTGIETVIAKVAGTETARITGTFFFTTRVTNTARVTDSKSNRNRNRNKNSKDNGNRNEQQE